MRMNTGKSDLFNDEFANMLAETLPAKESDGLPEM